VKTLEGRTGSGMGIYWDCSYSLCAWVGVCVCVGGGGMCYGGA